MHPPADRQTLQAERDALRARLAEIEAEMAANGCTVTLKQAAFAWGISHGGAWRRALKLETQGLAEHRRPGGWFVSERAL